MTQRSGKGTTDNAGWRIFMEDVASYADIRRLVLCFDGAIGDAACKRMSNSGRLHRRLSNLLLERHGLSRLKQGEPIFGTDQAIALSSAETLGMIALRAGAIYWSASFAAIIMGHKAAALHAALGEELCAFAVTNRDLGGPEQSLDPMETIRERVLSDGLRCVGAWCHEVSSAIGGRVRLKLPPSDLIDLVAAQPFAKIGAAIVRRAAG